MKKILIGYKCGRNNIELVSINIHSVYDEIYKEINLSYSQAQIETVADDIIKEINKII